MTLQYPSKYHKKTRLSIKASLFSFNHNDMIAKFSLDGRVGVNGILHGADRQSKCSILERTNHTASWHPAEVSLDKPQRWKYFMYIDTLMAYDSDYISKCVQKISLFHTVVLVQ